MANVMLTAVGSFSTNAAISSLKKDGHKVFGCDIYPKEWLYDAYEVDKFFQAPYACMTEEYKRFIFDICAENKIEFLLPSTDIEIDVLSGENERLKASGTILCISSDETIRICRNKLLLSEKLISAKIPFIIPSVRAQNAEFTGQVLFAKPLNGRGSVGCRMVKSKDDLCSISCSESNYIIQPYIDGYIIAADVARDKTGNCVSVLRRELIRDKSGAGKTVEIIENKGIEDRCQQIAEYLNTLGVVNMEFIVDEMGNAWFMEVNPRFGGGVGYSCMAGYDMIKNHIIAFAGGKIEKKNTISHLTIARRYIERVTKKEIKE